MSTEIPENEQGTSVVNSRAYLYETTTDIVPYVLLGTAVRALGKGWNATALVAPRIAHLELFRDFGRLLLDQRQLAMKEPYDLADISKKYQIALIDSSAGGLEGSYARERIKQPAHVIVAGEDIHSSDYDLVSHFLKDKLHRGGVTALTGTGKGKSTAAYGLAAAAVARGQKAAVVQWFKEPKGKRGTWSINEHYFPEKLREPERFSFHPMGAGFYGSPNLDRVKGDAESAYQAHSAKARQGLRLAKKLLASREYAVLVLDEFVDTLQAVSGTIPRSLLEVSAVQELLAAARNIPETQVVVTGRSVTPEWEAFVGTSYVTWQSKHPLSHQGKSGVSGLDF